MARSSGHYSDKVYATLERLPPSEREHVASNVDEVLDDPFRGRPSIRAYTYRHVCGNVGWVVWYRCQNSGDSDVPAGEVWVVDVTPYLRG
jgi:hypothetical protein